jgi:hypothetical protein
MILSPLQEYVLPFQIGKIQALLVWSGTSFIKQATAEK